MRMLDFKQSRMNLENCIISRTSKSIKSSSDEWRDLLVIEPK